LKCTPNKDKEFIRDAYTFYFSAVAIINLENPDCNPCWEEFNSWHEIQLLGKEIEKMEKQIEQVHVQ